LTGAIKESCENSIHAICGFSKCEVVELNVQPDHVHLVVMIPPKLAVSTLMGRLKGQSAMRYFGSSVIYASRLLGESFLGQRVLCGYGWPGCALSMPSSLRFLVDVGDHHVGVFDGIGFQIPHAAVQLFHSLDR
jgi:hypothetical protein